MTPEASIGRPSAMGMPTTTVRGEPPCRRPTPVVALPAEALDETPTVSAVCGSLPHTAQTAEPLQRKPCLVQGTDDATTNGATSRALVQSARAACPRHRGAPIANQRARAMSLVGGSSNVPRPPRSPSRQRATREPRRRREACRTRPSTLRTRHRATGTSASLRRTSPGRRATHRPPGGHPRARLPPHQPPLHRARVGWGHKKMTPSGDRKRRFEGGASPGPRSYSVPVHVHHVVGLVLQRPYA